jgi:O-antigen/teichoic acid export membrane protein
MRAGQMIRITIGASGVTISQALLGVITTPFLVHQLGAARYGIFAVITIVATYLSNLEIGFGQATLQFVARARAGGDADEERRVVNTGFAVFTTAGLTGTVIALLGSSFIADHFVHGDARGSEALDAIRIGVVTILGSLLSSFAMAALQGLGKFALPMHAKVIFGTLSSIGAVITVSVGGGLRAVLVVQLAVNIGQALMLLVGLARAMEGSLAPRVDGEAFRRMARYGVSVVLAGFAYQALIQGPPTILAGYATTDQVAAYAVPAIIMQQLVMLLASASYVFAPFASAQSIAADRIRLAEIFLANVRVTLLLAAPIAAYLGFLGKPVLSTWISSSFAENAIGPLRFLSVAALALAISSPSADVLRGLGKPSWVAAYTIGASLLALGGSFLLVHDHGATGVAAALGIAAIVATLVLVVVVAEQSLGISAGKLARALAKPVAAVLVATGMFAIGAELSSGFGGAVATGAVGVSAYVLVVFRWVLDDRERRALNTARPHRGRPADDPA